MPPVIWPRSAILHSAAHPVWTGFLVDRFNCRQNGDFGFGNADDMRQINGILDDVDLVFQRRRDVDRGIGDQ